MPSNSMTAALPLSQTAAIRTFDGHLGSGGQWAMSGDGLFAVQQGREVDVDSLHRRPHRPQAGNHGERRHDLRSAALIDEIEVLGWPASDTERVQHRVAVGPRVTDRVDRESDQVAVDGQLVHRFNLLFVGGCGRRTPTPPQPCGTDRYVPVALAGLRPRDGAAGSSRGSGRDRWVRPGGRAR